MSARRCRRLVQRPFALYAKAAALEVRAVQLAQARESARALRIGRDVAAHVERIADEQAEVTS